MQQARYTEQMPFVSTKTHRALVDNEAERDGVSVAAVIRRALDMYYGTVNGEKPKPA